MIDLLLLFRLFSWFWGWGQEKGEKAPSSLSLCSEDELKAHLHEARLKIAKIEMKTGSSGNPTSNEISNDIDCYSLEFKVCFNNNVFKTYYHCVFYNCFTVYYEFSIIGTQLSYSKFMLIHNCTFERKIILPSKVIRYCYTI